MTERQRREQGRPRSRSGLAARLRDALKTAGMSQADLASASGVSKQYVSDLMRGTRGTRLSAAVAGQLEEALGAHPGTLVPRQSVEAELPSVVAVEGLG